MENLINVPRQRLLLQMSVDVVLPDLIMQMQDGKPRAELAGVTAAIAVRFMDSMMPSRGGAAKTVGARIKPPNGLGQVGGRVGSSRRFSGGSNCLGFRYILVVQTFSR